MINNFPNLFKPIKLGGVLFRNRIFSAPTGLYNYIPLGTPTPDFIAYFERKAKGGAASVNIGECYVDDEGIPRSRGFIMLDDHETARLGLGKLADGITRHGAIATVELNKRGMVGTPNKDGHIIGPSERELNALEWNDNVGTSHAMSEEQILASVEAFVSAAEFAKSCGYGMAMVHAGHGWLLHQFLSPTINKRTDRWGGNPENRARIVVMICDEIHKRCGAGYPVEVRMSAAEEGWEGGYGIEEGVEIAKQLDGHADLIHVSVGNIFVPASMGVTHPGIFSDEGRNVKYAAEIRKHVKTPVATIGALSDPYVLEEIIATGKADIVEMARGLICDPDLPIKAREGREKEQYRCMRCFYCVGVNYAYGHLVCALNPESGREWEQDSALPPGKKQKVLIAGGGIAGMQTAITASQLGHEVVLCEKTGKLGGPIMCEKDVPFKKRLSEYVDRQIYMLAKTGVEIRLNTEVTPEYAALLNPDAIVAAVGSRPFIPPIPGAEAKNVVSAEEAFSDPGCVGSAAVILGAGLTGAELGLYLNSLGKKVQLIEMRDDIYAEHSAGTYKAALRDAGVAVHFNTKALEITETGVRCEQAGNEAGGEAGGGDTFYECDTVILAAGRLPLHETVEALSDCAPRFYYIGDCRTPRIIAAATGEAWTTARHIGRY
ncbi:MAG: NAD(P)/FAD-dependent oxidoreductase [Oscillospiraceae bacterium]|nr:NAD(P)/FAD-dependent oxidoreductase [Oscillospiraceae bacterium]